MNRRRFISGIFLCFICLSFTIPSLRAVTSRRDALLTYVINCNAGTGFADIPGGTYPTIESTYQAIYILNAYNGLGSVDSNEIIDFVNNCKNNDYGFGNTEDAESDIVSTYYACWIFNLFNAEIDSETYIWVADLQNGTSGFAEKVNQSETLYGTYFGLETLTFNGTDLSTNNVSEWLSTRQNTQIGTEGYGGFSTDGSNANMWATWAAIGALSRLGKVSLIQINPLVNWVNQCQNLNVYEEDYGSFCSKIDELDYNLLSTYAAVTSLQKLGATYLTQIQVDAALNWMINLQNPDGGFRVNLITADSSLSASYYAFSLLEVLGETDRLNAAAPWEAGFEMPLWGWILLAIAIAIIAVLLIRKYYLAPY
ncbi:MAG: prenyltransferase/squalene oxidase repeat-containing protein [Candidatus Helarchaeota archaeon]